MNIKRFVCNALQENAYAVSSGTSCVIIDPGFATAETGLSAAPASFPCSPEKGSPGKVPVSAELQALYQYLDSEGLTPEAILLTHSHSDHTLGVAPIAERFGVPVIADAEDGAELVFGSLSFRAIRTPGHTPDSVCYYNEAEHVLFTGDTLFAGTIGRTDLPGGNYDDEIRSIMEKLIFLPGETEIFPGHGPTSTIARERVENPFLEPFNEREEMPEL